MVLLFFSPAETETRCHDATLFSPAMRSTWRHPGALVLCVVCSQIHLYPAREKHMQGPTTRLLVDASGLQLSPALPRMRTGRRRHCVCRPCSALPCPQNSHGRHDLCASEAPGMLSQNDDCIISTYSAATSPADTMSIHSRGRTERWLPQASSLPSSSMLSPAHAAVCCVSSLVL